MTLDRIWRHFRFAVSASWLMPALCVCVLSTALPSGAEWHVVCDKTEGSVGAKKKVDPNIHTVMSSVPGPRSAEVWIEENCPSRACDAQGRCSAHGKRATESTSQGGWEVGEITTVTVGSPGSKRSKPASSTKGRGSRTPDLSPLINTAVAAAEACSFQAALAAADHMTNFDPNHPWLEANHEKIRDLARRQRETEQAVWDASSALSAGDLKRARVLAAGAADTSVSCQTDAVSGLLRGIETAIRQEREARSAANRRAAAALLPGLVSLARTISGGGQPGLNLQTAGAVLPGAAAGISYGVDRCAFAIEYQDFRSLVPTCTCPGYRFDSNVFRCVP